MTIALVSHTIAGSSNNNDITTTGIDTTGSNLLIAVIFGVSIKDSASISDSNGNSWTHLSGYQAASGFSNQAVQIWYSVPTTVGASHTVTWSKTSSTPTVAFSAWSGASGSPFDSENGATQISGESDGGNNTGAVVTTEGDQLIIVAGAGTTTLSISDPNGNDSYTSLDSISYVAAQHMGARVWYLLPGATYLKSHNPFVNGAVSNYLQLAIASFKANSPTLTSVDVISKMLGYALTGGGQDHHSVSKLTAFAISGGDSSSLVVSKIVAYAISNDYYVQRVRVFSSL